MRSMKVLRTACMLAVACGVLTTVEAVAQARDKPASPQARKAASTPAKSSAHQLRKQANKKHAQQGKKKTRPVAANKAPARKAVATAKAPSRQPVARPLPPPVAWVPPPLGPERFYPNGIPELRPEFMHPEAPARVEQGANSRPAAAGGQHTEWLP